MIYDTLHTCSLAYEVKSVMDYFPYGKHLRAWFAGDEERWQTTLNERDGESGLDWRGARMYDAEYGRFLQIDPMAGKFPHLTPYNYTENRPVFWGDPSGNCPTCYQWMKMRRNAQEGVHYALDVIGFIPGYGEVADGINAMMYAAEGRTGEALLSVGAMVPVEGVLPTLSKWLSQLIEITFKYSDEVAPLVKKTVKESTQNSREIITLTKSGKRTDALKIAREMVGDLGEGVKPHLGKFGTQKGKVTGFESADGGKGFRLDFDPQTKGAHINWWNEATNQKGAILFEGTEDSVHQILDMLTKTYE
ncbi:MAG: hypothetical protein H6581_25520 [Bacteroidia bacterium]|nr:hypothetical protein [Bacteroidia bacterium]